VRRNGFPLSALPVAPRLASLLRGYFQIGDQDERRTIRERVTGKLLTLDRTLAPELPALLTLLDVPVEDRRWKALDPPARRQRTIDALRRLLLRESQVQPIVVVFEDLHWIDTETQAALEGLEAGVAPEQHLQEHGRVLRRKRVQPELAVYWHGWGGRTY
jgi:hypothetical protein